MENTIINPKSGIYAIKNKANGKVYVGSAVNLKRRKQDHRRDLNAGRHINGKLRRAWFKYGESSFEFLVIEQIEDTSQLIEREQFWIDKLKAAGNKTGYNICPTAGSQLGTRHTPQSKEKNAAAHRGKKQSAETIAKRLASNSWEGHTEESRRKIALAATGRKHTAETKAKLRELRLLQGLPPIAPRTDEYKAKISATLKGRKMSEESRIRMSEARKGHATSEETRAKISAALKGRKYSEETIAKMAEASRGRKHTPEAKAKIALASAGRRLSPETIAKMQAGRQLQREMMRAKS